MFDDDRDSTYGTPQSKRAHVAHEDLSRMSVVPEETDACSDHGAAEHRELADLRHLLQLEILGETRVSAHVSQHR